jgi:uncharacterized membrane protein YtjA (UPF0391 family)
MHEERGLPCGCFLHLIAICKEDLTMLRTTFGVGIVFLVIALIAALFGFGMVSNYSWEGAKILFTVFLVLAVLSFLGGWVMIMNRQEAR